MTIPAELLTPERLDRAATRLFSNPRTIDPFTGSTVTVPRKGDTEEDLVLWDAVIESVGTDYLVNIPPRIKRSVCPSDSLTWIVMDAFVNLYKKAFYVPRGTEIQRAAWASVVDKLHETDVMPIRVFERYYQQIEQALSRNEPVVWLLWMLMVHREGSMCNYNPTDHRYTTIPNLQPPVKLTYTQVQQIHEMVMVRGHCNSKHAAQRRVHLLRLLAGKLPVYPTPEKIRVV